MANKILSRNYITLLKIMHLAFSRRKTKIFTNEQESRFLKLKIVYNIQNQLLHKVTCQH